MNNTHVAILRGGPSTEHNISLLTGKSVIESLSDEYKLKDILIDYRGNWIVNGIDVKPQQALADVDVVFNSLHGTYGEDGKIQQILEKLNIPFTGPTSLGAALSIDKARSKEIYRQNNILTPHAVVVYRNNNLERMALEAFRSISLPMVVKPIDKGSSIGVFIVNDFNDLLDALKRVLRLDEKVLVEEYIRGKEATVGIIEGFRDYQYYPLIPIEIRFPSHCEFFDYDAKYSGIADNICPGNFTESESLSMQEIATNAHRLLNLRHYSRSDFILSPRGKVYLLETNSLPALTKESLMPKALEPIGSNQKEFLTHIINLALEGK